jgi:type VI secretion system protein ImpC
MPDVTEPKAIENILLGSLGGVRADLFAHAPPATAPAPGAAATTPATPPPRALVALVGAAGTPLSFNDRDPGITDAARMLNALAVLAVNLPNDTVPGSYADLFAKIADFTRSVDQQVKQYLDGILHDPDGVFQTLEANWRGLYDLGSKLTADDVLIDFLDVSKDELGADLADNDLDIFSGDLFQKVYTEEYDSYGGRPFATMIGLYGFDSQSADIAWLRSMTKICAAAHCPFIASVGGSFFHKTSMADVAALTDLDAVMNQPKMAAWNELRNDDWAAYIGLTLPRYVVRLPWEGDPAEQPLGPGQTALPDRRSDEDTLNNTIGYAEISQDDQADDATRNAKLLWGNAAYLFAQNLVRSYESSGWAQHIRGPIGGGLVEAMTAYTFTGADGTEQLQPPVEITIPDFREYQFARNGLIALVNKKNEAACTFFSATSIKAPKTFLEDVNTQNAYLVTNLSYTFSITIIAHYVKVNMREYIGSTADATYIQQSLSNWLGSFVTTVNNPDDLTLAYYPFKATSVVVQPKPGPFGWYSATISILPWQQFEGMDVELRLEAALGAKGG